MRTGFHGAVSSLLVLAVVLFSSTAPGTIFQVGPTRAKKTLQSIATLVNPGDVVEVDGDVIYTNSVYFFRDGTAASPITIRGIRVNGHRPVISGAGLGTILGLVRFYGDHYVFEGFELDGELNSHVFRGIYHVADDVTLRDTLVHHFAYHGIHGSDSAGSLTLDKVEVYHCGSGQSYHQIYVASANVAHPDTVFRMQFCYLHDGNGGNNVKSRVGRSEIYYNWIEGAYFHELDLIGADPASQAANTAGLVREDADVVGNVFYKIPASPGVVARLGDDATGSSNGRYRFVNNTVLLPGNYDTTVFRVRGPRESVELHNNVFARVGGGRLQLVDSTDPGLGGDHRIGGVNNWLPVGAIAIPSGLTNTWYGINPYFANPTGFDFMPTNASPLLDTGQLPTPSPANYPFPSPLAAPLYLPPLRMPLETNAPVPRLNDGAIDLGAFEAPSLAPGILTEPEDVTRLQGQPAALTATAGGSLTNSNPLGFQWAFNGNPIPGATNSSFTFDAARTSDAGIYSVTVTNTFGSATSRNALLTVNPDTNKPSVTIDGPPDKAIFTNESITVSGTARDNTRVSGIFLSQETPNDWQPAATINQSAPNSANWSHTLTLSAGTNRFFVKSLDFAGTESTIVSRNVFLSLRSPLTIQTNGTATIVSTPNVSGTPTNGAALEITKRFLVTAMPGSNWLFSNWLASANGEPPVEVSTEVRYPFAMQSNLSLIAQFVTNRFIEAAGSYAGLFMTNGVPSFDEAGFLMVTVTAPPNRLTTFSGMIKMGGNTKPLSGMSKFGLNGTAMALVDRRTWGKPGLTVRLTLPFDGSDTLGGSVSNNVPGGWVADFHADRKLGITNYDGKYTMVIPGDAGNSATVPGGSGYGLVKITKGVITVAASQLGDKQTFAPVSAAVSKTGEWPLYSEANTLTASQKNSRIMGWVTVTTNDITGTLNWIRLPFPEGQVDSGRYPNGFAVEADILGSAYSNPLPGVRLIALTNGTLTLAGSQLTNVISQSVLYSISNKVSCISSNPQTITLTLAPAIGKVYGSFKPTQFDSNTAQIAGVILTNANSIQGSFWLNVGSGTNESGAFEISQ